MRNGATSAVGGVAPDHVRHLFVLDDATGGEGADTLPDASRGHRGVVDGLCKGRDHNLKIGEPL